MPRMKPVAVAAMTALGLAPPALAEQVFNEDVIVDGGLCAGNACASGDANANGLLAKSGNPSLYLVDTGVSSDRQWSVGTNQSDFEIRDFTGPSFLVPALVIENGLTQNRLYIDADGQIGFGTALPEQELHIIDGVNASIRLEQDTSGGFEAHTWDLSVGNSGFLIIDENRPFSTVPFTIENGAPTRALHIDASGTIGMGTGTPSTGLHVQKSDGTGAILIEETSAGTLGQMTLRNNGITFFTLEDTSIAAGNNTGRAWNFQNQAGTFRITTAPGGPGEIEMIMTPAGDMTIKGSLTTGGGTCGGGCDAVFSDEYDLPSIAEHAEAMWSLGHLPNVGPTVENAPINISDKLGRMLNELEHAHIYIAQQQEVIDALEAEKAQLGTEVAEIRAMLTQLIEAQ
ncbi:hypothetical protein EI983_00015 (plasmid) [Roseovarius faecimaris]|uniref:Uncharacterized protein n=1 Tax=Roseovarius faecimaris TaxID=2494550 RepID=A0A6I6ILI4_9RHOB|nr:hypothetical protein [Roseovarius faecimaris]QGX96741.1 hypothetical protein EI983_00015 [Roseovarius faecimaris]